MNAILPDIGINPAATDAAGVPSRATVRFAVCAGLFIVLFGWAALFPYTGDGDSAMHYLNARETAVTPVSGLHAWARPGAKLFMVPFALHGILLTRAAMAAVSALVAWHTIRLAEELRLPRALLAGPMILWQPLAFALASDTMTEMPMALGIIIALRLWRNDWRRASATLVGFLPMVRPEGFFLGVLWGAMVLLESRPGRTWRGSHGWRAGTLALMTLGLITWALACWALTPNHDPFYVLHIWNWPANSFAFYGRGSLFHHVILWPLYCGGPLTVLFLAGIRPSFRSIRGRPGMSLPWSVWLVVFGVHTVLYWRGWFASCGLMRIFACTSPITALVCLHGWNAVAEWLANRRGSFRPIAVQLAGGLFCTGWAVGQYLLQPFHYDCFASSRCVAYIRDHDLVGPHTPFFAGNQITVAQLGLPPHFAGLMETPCDAELIHHSLAALPIGSIGVWENHQAPVWHGHRIEDLAGHGFTILEEDVVSVPTFRSLYLGRKGNFEVRYAVLRKTGTFRERGDAE